MPEANPMFRTVVQGVADWSMRIDCIGVETTVLMQGQKNVSMTPAELRALASGFEAAAEFNDACNAEFEGNAKP